MVRVVARKSFRNRLRNFTKSKYFFPFFLFLFLLLALPVIILNLYKPQDIRQRAAGSPSATISFNPSSGPILVGQPFSIDLVINGGGQAFNAAESNITVSSNLTVQTLTVTPPESNGCNFTFVNTAKTPTISDPSFAGAILNNSTTNCTLYTLTLVPTTEGTGTVSISNGSVKAYSDSSEIFLSSTNGSYNLSLTPTPTFTPTPTLTPTATPTSTPTPPAPPAATIDTIPTETYKASTRLTGGKSTSIAFVFVNDSTFGVTYPTSSTWDIAVNLAMGTNSFTIYGKTIDGLFSPSTSITINRHKEADITGDGVVDLTDLSIFGSDYENTGVLNNALSDIDESGFVDLTDFSIIAKDYGL